MNKNMTRIIQLENVIFNDTITYPNIGIVQGKTTFITGESGTGKSTLLKLLNGVITPTSGSIAYKGNELASYDTILLRRQVLLVSQSAVLFDEQSIRENFATFFDYRECSSLSEAQMIDFLTICSIDMPLDKKVYHLSGGEKQRVFVAIHLALDFDVLMLDEPTSALDASNGRALLTNVKAYCQEKEKTLLVVSHDKEIVETFADHIIMLGGQTNG